MAIAKMGTGARIGIWMTAAFALSACGHKEQNFQPPPPEVSVKTVATEAVPLDLTYSARTVGSREVEVRARVGGILLKRRFEEGSRVKEGQPMFQIDPEPIRARLASARADAGASLLLRETSPRRGLPARRLVARCLASS